MYVIPGRMFSPIPPLKKCDFSQIVNFNEIGSVTVAVWGQPLVLGYILLMIRKIYPFVESARLSVPGNVRVLFIFGTMAERVATRSPK